jgi:peroxiredoxin Q/BCP
MVEIGALAPDFTLISDEGEEISLSDFRGHKVVLYFYPKADTPGCTKQACAVRDAYPQIQAGDALVIGISPDKPAALVKFRRKYDLPFVLLSDPDHKVAEMYGAWGEKQIFGKALGGILRSHFAVDEEGRMAESKLNVKPQTTADLALKLIEV